MVDIAISKMEAAKNPDWWDRVMGLMGYTESKTTTVNVQTNIQNVIKKENEKYL